MNGQCTVEIVWSTGVITKMRMNRREIDLLERFGLSYLDMKYELIENSDARILDYRVVEEGEWKS